MRAKVERFTAEDNGFIEVLNRPERVVSSGETKCKVVQCQWPIRVPLRGKVEYFSVKENGLIEILNRPKLVVPNGESICMVGQ